METSGNYEAYFYNPTDYTEVSQALPIYRGTKAPDTLYMTLTCDMFLDASGDEVKLDVYIDFVTAEGSIDQDTDEVYVTYD